MINAHIPLTNFRMRMSRGAIDPEHKPIEFTDVFTCVQMYFQDIFVIPSLPRIIGM